MLDLPRSRRWVIFQQTFPACQEWTGLPALRAVFTRLHLDGAPDSPASNVTWDDRGQPEAFTEGELVVIDPVLFTVLPEPFLRGHLHAKGDTPFLGG